MDREGGRNGKWLAKDENVQQRREEVGKRNVEVTKGRERKKRIAAWPSPAPLAG